MEKTNFTKIVNLALNYKFHLRTIYISDNFWDSLLRMVNCGFFLIKLSLKAMGNFIWSPPYKAAMQASIQYNWWFHNFFSVLPTIFHHHQLSSSLLNSWKDIWRYQPRHFNNVFSLSSGYPIPLCSNPKTNYNDI